MARNFLVIYKGKIVDIVTKDGNFSSSDTNLQFDTIGEDPSGKFKVGDMYSTDLYNKYNMAPEDYFKMNMPTTMPMVDFKAALDTVALNAFKAASKNAFFSQTFRDMLNSDTYDRSILNTGLSNTGGDFLAAMPLIKAIQDTVFYNYYMAKNTDTTLTLTAAPMPTIPAEVAAIFSNSDTGLIPDTTTAPAPTTTDTTTAPAPTTTDTTTAPAPAPAP